MTSQDDAAKPRSAPLTLKQMQTAVSKLKERIAELKAIDVQSIEERGEERFEKLEETIDATLASIFGKGTEEYERYRVESLDLGRVHMMYELSLYEIREGYQRGIQQAVANLRAVVELFGEKILAGADTVREQAMRALACQSLDPVIEEAVGTCFYDGRYAAAVERAAKALEKKIAMKPTGRDLSADTLVKQVAAIGRPGAKSSEPEEEQRKQLAARLLFAGATLYPAVPSALQRFEKDPLKAVEYVTFISFLAKELDRMEEEYGKA